MLYEQQNRVMFDALYAAIEKCGAVTVSITTGRSTIDIDSMMFFVDYLRRIKCLPTEILLNIATVLSEPRQYLTDEQAALLKVNRNSKTSRAIRKVLARYIDVDRDISPVMYTYFSDAINTRQVTKQYTVSNLGINEYGEKTIRFEDSEGNQSFTTRW